MGTRPVPREFEAIMKVWIRDRYDMKPIPAKRLRDNALLRIFPVQDDPAEQIPSQRDDGIETIIWHGENYEVFSGDLTWENAPTRISSYKEQPTICTSTDPTDHQGDTCPIHEESLK